MMNREQEERLKHAANNLSRAHDTKIQRAVASAHKVIKKRVTDIYRENPDVATVIRVEQILNAEKANVLGKLPGVYEQIDNLSKQAEIGMEQYRKFIKVPEMYVEIADGSRTGGGGQQFRDGLPRDPIRNTFVKFREQLLTDMMHSEGDPIIDREQTNILRLNTAITAERSYITQYLDNRKNEPEQKKQEHLKNFDSRMEKVIHKIEPPQQVIPGAHAQTPRKAPNPKTNRPPR